MKSLSAAQLTRLIVIAVGFVVAVSVWACETEEPTPVEPSPVASPTSAPVVRVEPTVEPTPQPTEIPPPTATSTPTPTQTPEPTSTSTRVPTNTPEPTATVTPAPTRTPTPTVVVPTSTPTNTPEPTETPSPTATSEPEPTPTPEPTSTSTPVPEVVIEDEELVVGDETLWGEYFGSLSEGEVSCIQTSLGEEDFAALAVRHVDSGERVADRHELAIWGCLSQQNAVDLYLSAFLTLEPDSDRTGEELVAIDACYRSLLQYADLATYIESAVVGEPNGGQSLMATSLRECSRLGDTGHIPLGAVPVYEARPINFAPNLEVVWRDAIDAVSTEERDCIQSELGTDRYETVLAEAVLDGTTEPWEVAVWRCLDRETAADLFKAIAPFGFLRQSFGDFGGRLERDNEVCLDRVWNRIDIPRLIEAGLPNVDLDDYQHGVAALIGIGLCIGSLPSIVEVDDHSDGIEGATEIAVGSFVEANLDAKFNAIFDQDVFQFIAVPGLVYELDLNYGLWGPIDFTGDEQAFFSIQVVGSDGRQEFITSRPVLWEPSRRGVHYLVVAGAGPLPYEFEVSISDYVDDFGDDFESATDIPIGGSVEGTIGPIRENDFFSFRAEAGETYQIDVSLEDDYRADLDDDDLRVELIGTDRNRIGEIEHRSVWDAPSSGEYFLRVYSEHRGSYSIWITVTNYFDDYGDTPDTATEIFLGDEVDGVIGEDSDNDFFYFDARAGQPVEISVETKDDKVVYVGITDETQHITIGKSPLIWEPVEPGRYFVRISTDGVGAYRLSINQSDYVDDHRNDEATVVLIGQPIEGSILNSSDLDAFSFIGVAGQSYEISVELETLGHALMWIYDSQGMLMKHSETEEFIWQARETGSYFVYLRSYSEGTYTFTVSSSDYRDDHGDEEQYATQLTPGETVAGVIGLDAGNGWNAVGNTDGDHDVFSFVAERGQLYSIDVELGSLLRSGIKLFDAAGDIQSSGTTRIVWEAARSGRHFVRVSGLGVGDYELTVARFDYSNDHGDDFLSATPIEIGEALSGTIGLEGESDYFRFTSTEGEAYQIDLISDGLQYPWLTLQNADGEELGSDSSQLKAQAAASKDFYIVVSSLLSTGEYSLSIKLLE